MEFLNMNIFRIFSSLASKSFCSEFRPEGRVNRIGLFKCVSVRCLLQDALRGPRLSE